MPLIVNLSCIHTLYPISTSVKAFTKLCKPSPCCPSCCPSFFQSWSNYAWVMYKYQTKYTELIEPYKLGKINTADFLNRLADLFEWHENNENADLIHPDTERLARYAQDPRLIPLETAWNAIIGLEQAMIPRFSALMKQEQRVFLISNTNELNVFAILHLLKNKNPTIQFFDPIDIQVKKDEQPIEIAHNIFLCLSYRFQCFKTDSQNKKVALHSTSSLVKYLIEKLEVGPETIHVVSQFNADLEEAIRLKIAPSNVHQADAYFSHICAPEDLSEIKIVQP